MHDLVLFEGTAHLDPLLSAGFGAQVPVFILFFVFLLNQRIAKGAGKRGRAKIVEKCRECF